MMQGHEIGKKSFSSEQNIPIDIYYNKLLDWLIDRRHCNKKWQEGLPAIRTKINAAIQDMPEHPDITKLLSGTNINYFHCVKIIDLLKECGEGSTNFFGQYSSKRMKDWQDIIQLYEAENVCLAEAAHVLQRNVNYEIPALKQQLSKCQLIQRECVRKENDCNRNAAVFKEKFQRVCKQMGLKGENVRQELLHLVEQLPAMLGRLAEQTRIATDAVNYYSSFVTFILPHEEVAERDVVPLIKFVIGRGNATLYEWKTGRPPSKIVKAEAVQSVKLEDMTKLAEDESGGKNEIDWGSNADDVIDFGEGNNIDWGDGPVDCGDNGDANGIDYGDAAAQVACASPDMELEITVEGAGEENPEGGVAVGNDALSVLENTATRNLFIDELMELQAFLDQRINEASAEHDMISVNQFQSAPECVQMQTADTLKVYLSNVTCLVDGLRSMQMQKLYLIKNSPRYVDRLTESFEYNRKVAEGLLAQIAVLHEKSEKAVDEQRLTEPKLQLLIEKTKLLQAQIASEISKKYKNRVVNIMGEINTI